MGQGIFYCGRCQRQLRSSDLDKGEAVRIDAQILCKACAPADARPDPGPAPPPSTRRIGTHRIPRVSDTPRSMRAASGRPPAPWVPFAAAGAVALVALLVVVGLSSGPGAPVRPPAPPDPPPVTVSPPPAPPPRAGPPPATAVQPPRPDPARELGELDRQIRPYLDKADFAAAQLTLEAARGRHPEAAWTSEIDRRLADVQAARAKAAPAPRPAAPPPSPPVAKPVPPVSPTPSTGPVAWWRLDDRTGTAAAEASGAFAGRLNGTAEWSADPPGVKLDGRKGSIALPKDADLLRKASGASFAAWILPQGVPRERMTARLVTIDRPAAAGSPSPRFAVEFAPDRQIRFVGRATDAEPDSKVVGPPVTLGRWQHVAVTVDYAAREVRIYLDGRRVEAAGRVVFAAPETSDTPAAGSALGAWGTREGGFFDGLLSDARLYARPLDPEEVAALAARPPGSPAPNEIAGWWRLDDRSGAKALDASGAFSGTLDGNAAWHAGPAALRLDGKKGAVVLGDDLDLLRKTKAATLTAWIRPDGGPSPGRIATFTTGKAGVTKLLARLSFEVAEDAQLRFAGKAADTEPNSVVTAPGPVAPDRWQHAAVIVDYAANVVRIFLDGREQKVSGKPAFTARETSDTPVGRGVLGAWAVTDGRVFKGLLSDIRLYTRALADDEIEKLAAARPREPDAAAPVPPAPPVATGPAAWWRLDGLGGRKAADSAGAFPGTLEGQAAWSDHPPALRLDGQAGAVALGEKLDLLRAAKTATLTAWIRPESNTALLAPGRIATFTAPLEEGRRPVSRMAFEVADGNHLRFVGRASDGEEETRVTASAARVVRDRWQHAAAVVDFADRSVKIYLDGREQAVTGGVGFTAPRTSDTPVGRGVLGAAETPDTRVFRGLLSDVRLYARALDAAEIAALAAAAPGEPDAARPERVKEGLVALYAFTEGSGDRVRDVSGFGEPLDLTIADPKNVRWLQGRGLEVTRSTALASPGHAVKIEQACKQTHELTVEAWVKPARLQAKGPARVVTMSANTKHRNFVLGQGHNMNDPESAVWSVRCRTSKTDGNGLPGMSTPDGSVSGNLVHLAFTRAADGKEQVYIDGVSVVAVDRGGDFRNWEDHYPLTLANDTSRDRTWLGEYRLVAIYARALTAAEIQRNFQARVD